MSKLKHTESIEELLQNLINELPIKATEIGWERIGEQMGEAAQAINALTKEKM